MLGLCKTHLGLKDILYKEAHMEYTLESVIKQKKEKKKIMKLSAYTIYTSFQCILVLLIIK